MLHHPNDFSAIKINIGTQPRTCRGTWELMEIETDIWNLSEIDGNKRFSRLRGCRSSHGITKDEEGFRDPLTRAELLFKHSHLHNSCKFASPTPPWGKPGDQNQHLQKRNKSQDYLLSDLGGDTRNNLIFLLLLWAPQCCSCFSGHQGWCIVHKKAKNCQKREKSQSWSEVIAVQIEQEHHWRGMKHQVCVSSSWQELNLA